MLETIREFAAERLLASAEVDAVRDAHLAFAHGLAVEGESAFYNAERLAFVNRLASEHDNIRAALAWSLTEPRRAADGLYIAAALYWYWQLRGHHSEARRWLTDLAAAAPDAAPALHAHAVANAGAHAFFQTDLAASRALLEESVARCRTSGDREVLAWALKMLAMTTAFVGDGTARTAAEESAALGREIGDEWGLQSALYTLGIVAYREGDNATARAALEESIAILERLGDRWTAASAYGALGRIAYRDGDYPRAGALLEECAVRMREIDDQPGLAIFLDVLGEVLRAQGDHERAVASFQESLRLSHDFGRVQSIALGLMRLATVSMAAGQHERAARLCGAAEAMPEPVRAQMPQVERAEYDRAVAAVRARLGDPAVAAAWAVGQAMPLEEAIAEALSLGQAR
jgi:tetratricopeptide (TPR) repeat protein